VSFTVKKPNGTNAVATATTGSTGRAVYSMKLGRKDPLGVYQVIAVALSSSATTSFDVQ
jgi:hypothetical protein